MMPVQGCHNCAHRYGTGSGRRYWRCSRVGLYVETETRLGGICAHGHELRLWSPRSSLFDRIVNLFRKEAP